MRLVLAPDSFKECMSSIAVCESLDAAAREVFPSADIRKVPMGDGGEGTLMAILAATGGQAVTTAVHDPLGRLREAVWGLLPTGDAFIEMAQASGLETLLPFERNPLRTTTFGTGELIRSALDRGCRRLTIGLGGSGTTDGGAGMVCALGGRLYGENGEELTGCGEDLSRLARIDLSGMDQRLKECDICVACDVTNPLCGPEGAAAVFGPQKGATPSMVHSLDKGLKRWAEICCGNEVMACERGDGAAGGLGFALRHVCGATMRSGGELVAELVGLSAAIRQADWVVTGEGRTDSQTLRGKLPVVVAGIARHWKKPCLLISGAVEEGCEGIHEAFTACFDCVPRVCSLSDAMAHSSENLKRVSRAVFRIIAASR